MPRSVHRLCLWTHTVRIGPLGFLPAAPLRTGAQEPGAKVVAHGTPARHLQRRRELLRHRRPRLVIGDRWVDIGLARVVGAKGVLVRTGYGVLEEHTPPRGLSADVVVDNLIAASAWILKET